MQSFIQYKNFRKGLEAQVERNKDKTEGLGQEKKKKKKDVAQLNRKDDPPLDLEKGEHIKSNASSDTQNTVVAGQDNVPQPQHWDPDHDPELERERILDYPYNTHSQHNNVVYDHPTEEVEEPQEEEREEENQPVDANDFASDGRYIPDSLEHRGSNHPGSVIQSRTNSRNNSRINLSRTPTVRMGDSNLTNMGTNLGNVMTGIDIRKRNTEEGGTGDVFIVGWEGDRDPQNPHNWSMLLRIFITFTVAGIGFVVGVASSIDSPAVSEAAASFHVGEVAEICATGLYLIGFGAGALFAGPFSETLGRNPVYVFTMVLYMIFIMASGLAPNLGAQLAFRFLAGFFGSTPLTCAGGSLSDIWSPIERTTAFPVFANAAFLGPILGPVMGGFIAESHQVSWRWVEWTTLIMSGLIFSIVVLFLPETFPPVLLKWKAKHLRDLTGDDRYRAEVEIRMDPFMTRLGRALYRPFLLTATEPIIMLVAL